MKALRKPYMLLALTSVILLLMSLIVKRRNNPIDIHFHDTYFVIAQSHLLWLLAFAASLIWTLYLLTNKVLYSKKSTWLHIAITTITVLYLASTLFWESYPMTITARKYYDLSNLNLMNIKTTFSDNIAAAIFLVIAAQIIFFTNLIFGLARRKK